MECSCACEWDGDGEPVKCYREHQPRALKAHRCAECRATIEPGTVYHLISYVWENAWWMEKRCIPCATIRADFAPCSGPGMMAEDIYECLGFWIFGPTQEIEDD